MCVRTVLYCTVRTTVCIYCTYCTTVRTYCTYCAYCTCVPVGELVTIAQRLRTIAHITLGTDAIYMSQTLSTRHAIDTQKKRLISPLPRQGPGHSMMFEQWQGKTTQKKSLSQPSGDSTMRIQLLNYADQLFKSISWTLESNRVDERWIPHCIR